jgi:DNA-binding NarL/FixJ family response regulator
LSSERQERNLSRKILQQFTSLAALEGFEVIGQASSVREALRGIEAAAPEAVTLDISLPDGSGVEVPKHIHRRGWRLSVVVLTGNLYEALQVKCDQLWAVTVLDKINGWGPVREAPLAINPASEYVDGRGRRPAG